MEETDTSKTKVSDSAYSTSCNSRSQRSSGSSKSHNSGSSNSSGYGGHASTLGSVNEFTQPASKRSKDKKKKGSRSILVLPVPPRERSKEDEGASGSSSVPENQPEVTESDQNGNASGLDLGPELVFGRISSPHDNEVLQIAVINQSLSFVQKLNSSTEEPALRAVVEECEETPDSIPIVAPPTQEKTSRTKEEFTAIISMSDGIVKHTSTGIVDVLGFPCDMWVGRSITDFVQAKDRAAFASHITSGVASPLTQLDKDCGPRSPFFCSLRCYRGLKRIGFGVKDKTVQFRPCQLMLTFREHLNGFPLPDEPNLERIETATSNNTDSCKSIGREQPHIYLVVTVNPISSGYKYPEETQIQQKFVTRLYASTHFSGVDSECVPYLGFLPQDMIGHSVLEFYHPEDMPFMKDVYEAVIKQQGAPFLSKPYRFRTQNGGYALLETEWSSFSNPWSRKLEFIIAQHRVLKGPPNPDVFATPPEGDTSAQMSEEVLKESKVIQEEIQNMLNEALSNTADNSKKRNLSKRCKVLASFVDSMLEESKKTDLCLEVPPEDQSFSERDSVMLGEISPHHEYYDSKSSSETPPSYNQLNYNDNIQRFFESKPKTTRSDESNKEKTGSPGKISPEQDSSLGSGDSGSGGGSGGGSGEMTGTRDSATSSSHNSYLQPMLTEAILTRHNENMEKRLVQRHREQRSKGDKRDKYHKALPGALTNHGVKRIGSQSWENDSFKGSKHLHVENQDPSLAGPSNNPGAVTSVAMPDGSLPNVVSAAVTATTTTGNPSTTSALPALPSSIPSSMYQNNSSSVWPPFSVTVTPLPSSQVVSPYSSYPLVGNSPHMLPMYYMGLGPQDHPGPPHIAPRNPFIPAPSYMPAAPNPHLQLVYQPIHPSLLFPPLTMLNPSPTMLPTSLFPPGACLPSEPARTSQTQTQAQASSVSVVGQSSQRGQQQQPMQPNQQLQSQQQLHHQLQPPLQQQIQQAPKPSNMENGSCHMQCEFQRPSSQATSVKAEPGSALGSVASASRQALSVSSNKNKSPSPYDNLSPDEDKAMEDRNQSSERRGDESSYYSSLCSYLCTDNSDESMRSCKDAQHEEGCWSQNESLCSERLTSKRRPIRSGPPFWMENLSMTPDVIFGYQLGDKELNDVLNSDLLALHKIEQPPLVNEQLNQLYQDLTIEGATPQLTLEEGLSSSGSGTSSSDDASVMMHPASRQKTKKKRRSMEYGRLIMIFEENAPMPPPITTAAS